MTERSLFVRFGSEPYAVNAVKAENVDGMATTDLEDLHVYLIYTSNATEVTSCSSLEEAHSRFEELLAFFLWPGDGVSEIEELSLHRGKRIFVCQQPSLTSSIFILSNLAQEPRWTE
jgi:hypothetical protein